jgi:predicted hydrocarbon binding protein
MLRRIGKASFQYAVREQAAAGRRAALKLLPTKQRIKFILNATVNALKKSNPQVEAWVEEWNDIMAYCDASCGICHGRQSSDAICHLYIGSIGEAVHWATGQEFRIVETLCTAKGDPHCRFEVRELESMSGRYAVQPFLAPFVETIASELGQENLSIVLEKAGCRLMVRPGALGFPERHNRGRSLCRVTKSHAHLLRTWRARHLDAGGEQHVEAPAG